MNSVDVETTTIGVIEDQLIYNGHLSNDHGPFTREHVIEGFEFDHLDVVEICLSLGESINGLDLEDDEFLSCKTIGDLITNIEEKLT